MIINGDFDVSTLALALKVKCGCDFTLRSNMRPDTGRASRVEIIPHAEVNDADIQTVISAHVPVVRKSIQERLVALETKAVQPAGK